MLRVLLLYNISRQMSPVCGPCEDARGVGYTRTRTANCTTILHPVLWSAGKGRSTVDE